MPQNDWNPTLYEQKHAFVTAYGEELLALLALQPGERILDLGCGTGQLTDLIAQAGACVTGLDNSPAMIAAAQEKYPQLAFVQADAAAFDFAEPFDAVFSNAVLHWVNRAEDAIGCITRALKPGGRFVAEFGGKGNTANVVKAVQEALSELTDARVEHSWYYPSIGEYAALLEKHGLAVTFAALFDRPTKLEGADGMRNWLAMFAERMFAGLSEEAKLQALALIEEKLRGVQYLNGDWFVDYRRLRVAARKE